MESEVRKVHEKSVKMGWGNSGNGNNKRRRVRESFNRGGAHAIGPAFDQTTTYYYHYTS